MESYDFNLVFVLLLFQNKSPENRVFLKYINYFHLEMCTGILANLDHINVDLCLFAAHLRGSQKLYSIIIGTAEMKIHF